MLIVRQKSGCAVPTDRQADITNLKEICFLPLRQRNPKNGSPKLRTGHAVGIN